MVVGWCTSVLFLIFNKARWEPRTSSSELSVCCPLLNKVHWVWRAGQKEETAWTQLSQKFSSPVSLSWKAFSWSWVYTISISVFSMYWRDVNHPNMLNLYCSSQMVIYFISGWSLHETLTGHICSVPQVTEISLGAPHHSQSFVFLFCFLPPNSSMAICSEPPKKTE